MFQKAFSCVLEGFKGLLVEIECSVTNGFPCFHILGLSASYAAQTHERLRAAMKAGPSSLPAERITFNVIPVLSGSAATLDLAMASLILASQHLVPPRLLEGTLFVGQLGLDGALRPLPLAYYYAQYAKENRFPRLVVPLSSLKELEEVSGIDIIGVADLNDLCRFLRSDPSGAKSPAAASLSPCAPLSANGFPTGPCPDLAGILGQEQAKRALVIACCGFHNLLLSGPPGIGKTMLAQAAPALLPKASVDAQREIQSLHTLASLDQTLPVDRPVRSPHHTITAAAFLGGGVPLRPGEISLAHQGILFLDELALYSRDLLEALRTVLEQHYVTVNHIREKATYPADFMLIGGMNPCPCGYYPDNSLCHCSASQVQKYQSRVSGPLSDRFDLVCHLKKPSFSSHAADDSSDSLTLSTKKAQLMIQAAHDFSFSRQGALFNARIPQDKITDFCRMTKEANALISETLNRYWLSLRSYYRTVCVARTIADLAQHPLIEEEDFLEALSYLGQRFMIQ